MAQRNTRLTNEEFLERMKDINPNIEFLSKYETRKTRISCKCKICNYEWSPTADKLLLGRGCPICAINKRPQCKPYSHEDFMDRFLKTGNDKYIEILGNYVNANHKMKCKCKICGYVWETLPSVLIDGHKCKKCEYRELSNSISKSNEDFVKEFNEKGNENIELIGSYKNCNTKIKVKCKLCGKEYMSSPNKLLLGHGCMDCYRKNNHGENHPRWKPEKTNEERLIQRKTEEYYNFIRNCMERDSYTCQITGQVGRKLNVHHLDGYSWCKEKRTDIDNGITLCEEIHKEFHSIYGIKHNTREQFIDFVNKLHEQNRITDDGYNLLLNKLKK